MRLPGQQRHNPHDHQRSQSRLKSPVPVPELNKKDFLVFIVLILMSTHIHSFIHSFISSRDYYSEATKEKGLQTDVNLEGWVIRRDHSLKGRSFHADGPTTEKALRCIIAKRARGTKSSPLAAEHMNWNAKLLTRISCHVHER